MKIFETIEENLRKLLQRWADEYNQFARQSICDSGSYTDSTTATATDIESIALDIQAPGALVVITVCIQTVTQGSFDSVSGLAVLFADGQSGSFESPADGNYVRCDTRTTAPGRYMSGSIVRSKEYPQGKHTVKLQSVKSAAGSGATVYWSYRVDIQYKAQV